MIKELKIFLEEEIKNQDTMIVNEEIAGNTVKENWHRGERVAFQIVLSYIEDHFE